LKKEIKDTRKTERPPMFIDWQNIVKIAIPPKAIYRLNAVLIKIPMLFFMEIEKANPNFIVKHKNPQISKTILRKKSNAGGNTIPDFKLYYKAIAKNTKTTTKNSMVLD
jgi:hypothetical protein